jgi:hypothetical protein
MTHTLMHSHRGVTTGAKWREADAGMTLGTRLHTAGYRLWTRAMDGEVIFRVEHYGQYPNKNSGGYRSIEAACFVKGVTP